MKKFLVLLYLLLFLSSCSTIFLNITKESFYFSNESPQIIYCGNKDTKTVRISDLLGEKVTIVTLHTEYCPVCDMQLKDFEKLYKEYKDKGLSIVSLVFEDINGKSDVKSLLEYGCREKEKFGLTFYSTIDPQKKISQKYFTEYLPITFILNGEGKVLYNEEGYAPETIEAYVKYLTK
jgi:peroxiredoxin